MSTLHEFTKHLAKLQYTPCPCDLAPPLHFAHSLQGVVSPESCWDRVVEQTVAATWSSKLRSF